MVFNVLDFGAVGNGTADDTTAITATITAANTAGGGTVVIPQGRYRIPYSLVLEDLNGITLTGENEYASVLAFDNAAKHGIRIRPSAGMVTATTLAADVDEDDTTITVTDTTGAAVGQMVNLLNVPNPGGGAWSSIIRNISGATITLDGRSPVALSAATTTVYLIGSAGPSDVVIEGLGFNSTDPNTPLTTRPSFLCASWTQRTTIQYCRFHGLDVPSGNADAIFVSSSLDTTIQHNHCETIGGINSLGIDIWGSTSTKVLHNRMRNTTVGVCFSKSPLSVVHDNTLIAARDEAGGVIPTRGLKLLDQSNRSKATGNHIENFSTDSNGIFLVDSARCLIADNTINSCGNAAIMLSSNSSDGSWTHHNQIAGNQIHDIVQNNSNSNGIGICLTAGTRGSYEGFNTITDNTIDGCDGNGIVVANQKNTIRGNTIHDYGRSSAMATAYNGAVGVCVPAGTSNLIEGNMIANALRGKAIVSNRAAGGNFIGPNTLPDGDTVSLHTNDICR